MSASAREREVEETVRRLGSAAAAAAALGISRITVDVTVAHYHQKMCADREAENTSRIAELEREVAYLRSRPPRIVTLDHRRLADGGRSKRTQIRAARVS